MTYSQQVAIACLIPVAFLAVSIGVTFAVLWIKERFE